MQVRCSNKAFCRLIYVLLLSTLMCLLGTNVVLGQGGGGTLEPDPLIHSMVSQVVSPTVTQYVGGLSGEWSVEIGGEPYTITTRHTDSITPVQKATQFVGEHLDSLGLDVEYHEWEAGRPPNVIGELTGLTDPDDIYIICAHLDDRPSGPVAPGADDNASGSAAVLIAADILTQYQWGSTLRFALWTGEEQWMLGSRAYVEQAHNGDEDILGVLNLDQIGYSTIGSSHGIELNAYYGITQTLELAQLFADVIDVYNLNLTPMIDSHGFGRTDHRPFWDYGYPAILGIEDREDFNPYYHTTDDLLANMDIDYLTEFVKAAVGTFAHMSNSLVPVGVGHLDGTVTAASDGAPITVAKVTATDSTGYELSATTDATGTYTRSLLAGTYTVTVAAYGYLPFTTSDVVILTDTVTGQDFALETASFSTYVVSGTVTSAGRGWSLPAHITIQGDPVDPPPPLDELWTDPVSGYYSVTLAEEITYTFHVEADHHLPQDHIVGPLTGDETRDLALPSDFGPGCPPGYTPSSIFYDGFESGDLGSTWRVYTTAEGRVRVDTTYPHGGNYGVLLDSAVTGTSSFVRLILERDLAAYDNVKLDFGWRGFYDGYPEHHYSDGVLIREGYGESWRPAFSFYPGSATFRNDFIDIGAEAAAHSLTLNDHFQITFQIKAQELIPDDGYAFDEVRLISCVPYAAGRVAGYVTDGNTSLPLAGAVVSSDSGQSTITDGDGFYELVETPGSHLLTATMAGGYAADIQNPTVVQSTTVRQDFYLAAGTANEPPQARDDATTTDEDIPVIITVLANDSDADGDSLSVSEVSDPPNGTAMRNPDDTITYTPHPNFCSSDSFTYTVTDGAAFDTAIVNVTVTCINDPPQAISDAITTDENTPVTIDVLANDSDVDGDSLLVDSVNQPANGTAIINLDNTITYQPNPDFCGSDGFTYTATDGVLTATATVTVTVTESIFGDGFESGDLSAWSAAVTDDGDLSVTGEARLVGAYGLQAVIDDNHSLYLLDSTPVSEPRYRARFYFDPNSITMAHLDSHQIFGGFDGGGSVLRLQLRFYNGGYQIRVSVRHDDGSRSYTSYYTISDGPHFVEVDWQAATADGAIDGSLSLWIDGQLRQTLSGIDNDTRRVEGTWLGPWSGLDTGTRGTYYLDAFQSQRQSYIGP
jgi:hypothetical protein